MKKAYSVAITIFVVCSFTAGISAQNILTLSIDSAKSTIKREIYGALMENWGRDIYGGIYVGRSSAIPNTNGMRNDIIEGLKECGISTLEFPGGCFADEYHWKDGIGAVTARPGGESKNGMGTDEYMQLCSLINAEPYLCADLKNGTPAEMAEWIKYINENTEHPEWHLKYLSMGNEPWGCGGDLSASAFANQYAQFVASVPVTDGKPVVRVAGAGTWDPTWVNTVFDKNPGKCEGFSVHRYLVNDWTDHAGPSVNYSTLQYHQIINLAYGVPDFINQFDDAMNKYDPDKKFGLMYNEWGAWYTEMPEQGYTFSQSTVRDALIAAIHLNSFNNSCERVHMACVAQPVNVIQSIFLTDKNDQSKMVKTPVFYTFKMFKVHQTAKKIPVTLQSASFSQSVSGTSFNYPYLTASASLDSTGNINITISNTELAAAEELTVKLNGAEVYTSATGQIITAADVKAFNDFGKAEQVNIQPFSNDNFTLSGKTLTVTVPSKCVILLTLTPESGTRVSGTLRTVKRDITLSAVRQRVYVTFPGNSGTPARLSLYGVDGRQIAVTTVAARGMVSWQVPEVGNGMYIIRVETDGFAMNKAVAF